MFNQLEVGGRAEVDAIHPAGLRLLRAEVAHKKFKVVSGDHHRYLDAYAIFTITLIST